MSLTVVLTVIALAIYVAGFAYSIRQARHYTAGLQELNKFVASIQPDEAIIVWPAEYSDRAALLLALSMVPEVGKMARVVI